jgi:hypothetical protein
MANEGDNLSVFFIATDNVPDEVIDFAISNVFGFLVSRSGMDSINVYNVKMGFPFTISKESMREDDVYYFPVYSGEKIIYTFRVYLDGDNHTGILSQYLAEELTSTALHK